MGRLRDAGLDARIVRDGKQSPGAWMYVGHDPYEPMTVVVPEEEVPAAREVLELEEEPAEVPSEPGQGRRNVTAVLVAVVAVVLVAALLKAQLGDVLPFLGEP